MGLLKDAGLLNDSGLLNDYGVKDPWFNLVLFSNPFFFDERNELFRELITVFRDYVYLCSDNSFWEHEPYMKRKKAHDELKIKKKKINKLLNNLIPKGATNKKGKPAIRNIKLALEPIVYYIETRKPYLGEMIKRYKNKYKKRNLKMERKHIVDEILEKEVKLNKPKKITIYYRTNETILISLVAHYLNTSYSTLRMAYYSIDAEKRKDIASNPKKYF